MAVPEFQRLARRVEDLERRMHGVARPGRVVEVDAASGTCRLEMSPGYHSARVPYAQIAGALRVHSPPSVGQQMLLVGPEGDPRQGVALPYTWSAAIPSPASAGEEQGVHVLEIGQARVELAAERLAITLGGAGGATLELTPGGAAIAVGGTRIDLSAAAATVASGGTTLGVEAARIDLDAPEVRAPLPIKPL